MSTAKTSYLDANDKEAIELKRQLINRIKANHRQRLCQSNKEVDGSPSREQQAHTSTITQPQLNSQANQGEAFDKNKGVSDTDKMLFQKKFKNYLNHRQEYLQRARNRCTSNAAGRKEKQPKIDIGDAEYYNQEEVLSNTGSEYQYRDASDMQAAYQQITTGKKRKGAELQLYHCQLYQNQFRRCEFQALLAQYSQDGEPHISKDHFLNYLFDQPIVMMLYSVNPYQLGDQLAEFQTNSNGFLTYQEFSNFLLIDREPTYFDYTIQNLAEARKLGRGIKCAPIIAKWVDESGVFELLVQTYKSIDMRGDSRVDRVFLAKKLRKQAQLRRLTELEVIEVININKLIPLNRILYEIQFEQREGEQTWSLEEFEQFLKDYKRRKTPQKDRLITKLIMAGKYDSSYVYILSQEALQFVKDVFNKTPKFAQYFVVKQKLLQNICHDTRYNKIKNMWVRSETNRYVKKQTFQDALVRILAQGQSYLDIQEVQDFLSNRGRPKLVEYKVYIQNLQRQMAIIEQEQRLQLQKYGQNESGSSDDEFNEKIKKKRIQRKQQKLRQIRNSNNFDANKKFNVTIPLPFAFDIRDNVKKISIREQKLKQMLAQKERQLKESMKPIKPKQVPDYVKENLYAKMLKDQERQRKQRLEKFRLEIMSQVNVSDRLMRPKSDELHCDFSSPQYKFTARPMPWYCEVNLIDRINRQKQERREKILQQIITKNTDYDLPEGVQRMIDRQTERQQRRAQKARTASTGSIGQCTFIPKISSGVPDFKTIHEHLHFDLENAKNAKQPLKPEPFSFDNRPVKSRTTYQPRPLKQKHQQNTRHSKYERVQHDQDFQKIPKTQKFAALVEHRRRQHQLKEKKKEQQKRGQAVRKLRQSKFAPVVWRALKNNNVIDQSKSRAIIEERMKQFRRQQKKKREQYENQMIRILTKVYQRPLLLESRTVQNQPKSKSPEKSVEESNIVKSKVKKEQKKQKKAYLQEEIYNKGRGDDLKLNLGRHRPLLNFDDDKRRQAVQEHQLGNYPAEGDQQDYDEDQEDFHQMYEEEYQPGNLHTS